MFDAKSARSRLIVDKNPAVSERVCDSIGNLLTEIYRVSHEKVNIKWTITISDYPIIHEELKSLGYIVDMVKATQFTNHVNDPVNQRPYDIFYIRQEEIDHVIANTPDQVRTIKVSW